jgi:hypothetical protein
VPASSRGGALDRAVGFARLSQCVAAGLQPLPASQSGFHPRQPLNHIAPLPRSLWDSEVVGWVVRCAWLNQNNVFVGIMRAQRIEHAPSDDASILNLCFSGSGHGYAPVGCRLGGSTTSLSAIGARRFVVLFSADDDRQCAFRALQSSAERAPPTNRQLKHSLQDLKRSLKCAAARTGHQA